MPLERWQERFFPLLLLGLALTSHFCLALAMVHGAADFLQYLLARGALGFSFAATLACLVLALFQLIQRCLRGHDVLSVLLAGLLLVLAALQVLLPR